MPHTENGGTRLFWTESGAGPAVLLIQGFGYTHDMWYRTVPALSPRFQVIRFDNRGVGMSDVPPGAYRVGDMAEDAAAVLDAAEVDAAFVVGASLAAPSLRSSRCGTHRTPDERIDEDLAIRLRTYPSAQGTWASCKRCCRGRRTTGCPRSPHRPW